MPDHLEIPFADLQAKTSAIRRWLMLEGEDEDSRGFSSEMAANVRAWALVWMCAAAEAFWVQFVSATCNEFSRAPPMKQRRKLRAQSIFFMNDFFSTVTSDLDRRWERSFSLIEKFVNSDRSELPLSIPYDGKTVRPLHIQLFWELFEIPGEPFPSMVHRQSLQTLADDRNRVAHGEILPLTLGRLRTKADVKASLARLEETTECVYTATRTMLGL